MKKVLAFALLALVFSAGSISAVPVGKYSIQHSQAGKLRTIVVDCPGLLEHYTYHPADVIDPSFVTACTPC